MKDVTLTFRFFQCYTYIEMHNMVLELSNMVLELSEVLKGQI